MFSFKRCLSLFMIFILLLYILTGCWSSRDIEKLDMLFGVGVDLEKNNDQKNNEYGENFMHVTFQLANVNKIQSATDSLQGQNKPYINIEEVGGSILEVARKFILKRNNLLNGQHQRLILLSSEIAEEYNLRSLLDLFIRDPEVRTSCVVMITDKKAKDILNFKEAKEIPSLQIFEMKDHIIKTTKILEPATLAKINARMNAKSSFLLQNITTLNDELKLSGASVIKGDKLNMIGFLNEQEVEGLSWLTAISGGGIVPLFYEKAGHTIIYELESLKSKVTPELNNDQLSFHVKVESEGIISEVLAETEHVTKKESVKELEQLIEKKVNTIIENSLKKIQKEYKVDVINFSEYVSIKYPDYWKKHKEDWDTIFSNSPINYDVSITITGYGGNISN
ncbi:Ger(x)C family spore germination protein [Alkalihalobacillus sp. BA299]|uniref:Ger(x)C family spore germination protein n=1 Tax=Alkalihalobacillus sp. BA299 TaxID=2815938 RepID=UPI001ADBE91A|nr:Ger(x)C family spore germination protein [Alkalihalobacillus sp. BA299]